MNNAQSSPLAARPARSAKAWYGLAHLGASTINGVFAALLPMFYQDYLGLSARWIGIASIVYAVWNAINDPLFGQITDSTRSKYGRRIPYLRFTAPFLAFTFVLVWFTPIDQPDISRFWWMLATMLLYDTCYTIIGLTHGALLPEMTEDDVERSSITTITALTGLVGTLFGFLIPDYFRPKAGMEDPSLLSLQLSMIAVGLIFGGMIFAASFKLKERREFSVVDKPLKLSESLRHTLVNKSFLIFVAMNFMSTLMGSMSIGAVFYVADYVTRSPTIYLLAALFFPILIGVPFARLVLKRMEPVRAQQIYMAITATGLITLTFMPAGLVTLSLVITGLGLSGTNVITYLLLAQVIDEDEVKTGVRREGSYYGANALITKPAQSVALALTPFVLEAAGFVTRESNNGLIELNQPASALFGIRAVAGLVPGIALMIGALILFAFPLHGAYLRQVKQTMLGMHAEKKARLEAIENRAD